MTKCNCHPFSPFHWEDDPRPSIFAVANLNKSLNNSLKQTTYIEQERKKGRDISHVAGLSTKDHAERILGIRQFVVFSRVEKIAEKEGN